MVHWLLIIILYLWCNIIVIINCSFTAAQQRAPAGVQPKLSGTSAMFSRPYTAGRTLPVQTVSATRIAQELLHTQGLRGLYRGLGATLMR